MKHCGDDTAGGAIQVDPIASARQARNNRRAQSSSNLAPTLASSISRDSSDSQYHPGPGPLMSMRSDSLSCAGQIASLRSDSFASSVGFESMYSYGGRTKRQSRNARSLVPALMRTGQLALQPVPAVQSCPAFDVTSMLDAWL